MAFLCGTFDRQIDPATGKQTGLFNAVMAQLQEDAIMSNLIPKHGGYRKLKSFQVAQLVYDVTVRFCDKFISKRSRTHDQMVQAARSGVQNIAEGSQASELNLACYFLDRQVERLAQDFETEGGFTERLYKVRTARRRYPT